MDRQNRKYHRDFDFKHYYKFVPPITQVLVGMIKPFIGFAIAYVVVRPAIEILP